MQSIVSRRPSPALLIAVLALIAAVAGTAIAGPQATTNAISKKDVKRIAKKQAVKQIKNTLGGLKATKISYSAAANTGAQTIFAGAGLRLAASCGAAGELDLDATTTKNDSNIFLTSVVPPAPTPPSGSISRTRTSTLDRRSRSRTCWVMAT